MRTDTIDIIAEILGVSPSSIIEVRQVVNRDAYEVFSTERAIVQTVSGLDVCRHERGAS